MGLGSIIAAAIYTPTAVGSESFSDHKAAISGYGIGDTYGGLFGARIGYQFGHQEVGACLGLIGAGLHGRVNMRLFSAGPFRFIPTATAGFGPSILLLLHGEAAGMDGPLDYHGVFAQGGGSLCIRSYCLNVEVGPHLGLVELEGGWRERLGTRLLQHRQELSGNGFALEVTVGVDIWNR